MSREVYDVHLFGALTEVREIVHEWMTNYNVKRPSDYLDNIPPRACRRSLSQTKN